MSDETDEGPKPPSLRIVRPEDPPREPPPEPARLIPLGTIVPSIPGVVALLKDFQGNAERGYLAAIAVVAVRTDGALALGVVGNPTTWPSLAGAAALMNAEIVGKIYETYTKGAT